MDRVSDRSELLVSVRAAFDQAGYTVAGVRDLLGATAGGALARDEIVPALRVTRGGSPLEAFARLFWLQVPVNEAPLREIADVLVATGLAERSGDELRALLHVEPLESVSGEGHAGHVVSDLKARPGSGVELKPDHVVGTGGASANLARLVVHRPVDNALDLGTGCGVQAVHLADASVRPAPGSITATDVNPRALRLARMSFALSGLEDVETLEGSLHEPVRDRTFDLIVSNPPFVIGPPDAALVYRESGLHGDEFCRRLVTGAPALLTEGGTCQLLANWLHIDGVPWEERVGSWLRETGCDAWAVQRDVQDPAEYAELWLRDSVETGTPAYTARYDAWLDYFESRRVTGIGFGWITLRRTSADSTAAAPAAPAVRVEELRHAVEQPVGAYVGQVLDGLVDGAKFSTGCGDLPLATTPVVQEQIGPPGAEDPERIVLRQTGRLRRAAGVGTVEAALAGVCDGTLPLDPLLDAIAQLMALDADQVRAHAETVLPELIADGFFELP
ncbi:class I SAM-dependent methyltransferase [Actinomadura barringtoniae]|uniref:Class I SAM-dependent methyltransferase n=1 Tax=Actinomadura barringtoniae TaxID=1427535 RepID=A0A939PFY5_9ACTN|nr:class I SAM-dependent methyltransferase [Actinomadura barringtoniae]MBO2449024.1 class I SAM-dependent methyltransferase [Actinomadura barringtoniae]